MAFNRTKITAAVTPDIDAGNIYADNDALSSAALVFDQGGQNDGGLLVAVSIYDADSGGANSATFRIWLFNAEPTEQTLNDAVALVAGDFDGFLGWVDIAASDWDGRWCYKDGINLPYQCNGSVNIWAVVEVTGAFTFTGASDLQFRLHIAKD